MNQLNHNQPPVPPPVPVRPPAPPKRTSAPRQRAASTTPRSKRRGRMPIRKELSAGGVVVRQEGASWLVALLQTEHKRGKVWVLPKGHVELHTGERVSDAAKREVQEEAGLSDLSVKNQLGVTRFKFQVEDAVVYKTVHYFLMTTQQKQLVPQLEEGLIAADWFPIDEAIEKLEYDTDQDIVRKARERVLGVTMPRPTRRTTSTRPGGPRRRLSRIHT